MSKSVDYKTAPIGTVAAIDYTTLVKNDKGWYWLEGELQEDDGHIVPRYEIHRFELGEVITPETLAWLPPGSVIAPKREDHAMVRNDDGGWGWADGNPGAEPMTLVARWVAGLPYKLTKFPGLESEDAYENAPVEVDPRQTGTVSLDYTYNPEKGTVYAHSPHHRDFGHVVKLPSGRYMAVPVRAVRDFATEQEAVEWLI